MDKSPEKHSKKRKSSFKSAMVKKKKNLMEKLSEEKEKQRIEKELSTVSIAVPGSILDNAHSLELKTYLAGQIARAACIYNIDEIVIYDDSSKAPSAKEKEEEEEALNRKTSCAQMARILQYLECPQYLRKFFFPLHKDLKFCGLLNPLDAPHHLRQSNNFIFREGVVVDKETKSGSGCYVNIGLRHNAMISESLSPGIRVTVQLPEGYEPEKKNLRGIVVSPSFPREETGVYWGYTVRIADSISAVFSQSPHDDGYDLILGTSDRGTNIHEIEGKSLNFKHGIIVFGGVMGIEYALENDQNLSDADPSVLFDHYINTAPNQGSRTIRTEEAVLITLARLQDKLKAEKEPKVFNLFDSIPQSQDTKAATLKMSKNFD